MTARLSIPVDLVASTEPMKNLAYVAKGVNDYVTGVTVRCAVCKQWGKVNSKLHRSGPFTCGNCR